MSHTYQGIPDRTSQHDAEPPVDERDGYTFNSYRDFAATGWGGQEQAQGPSRVLGPLSLAAVLVVLWYFGGIAMVVVVLALILSIVLHELGHFLTAKWAGMKVTEFFVGFGPRIWSMSRGETEYGVKVIPAGAYVRIVGMHNLEEVDLADEGRTYRSKPYPKRLMVILAGPLMNILLGFLLFVVVFAAFGPRDPGLWSVKSVTPGSAAQAAGLRPGDRVLAIDYQRFSTFSEMRNVLDKRAGQQADITVLRDGKTITLAEKPLGWRVNATGAAAISGMKANDAILDPANENAVRPGTYADFADELARGSGPYKFKFQRGYYIYENTVDRPLKVPADGASGFFGISQDDPPRVRDSIPGAVSRALSSIGSVVTDSGKGLARLFSFSGLQQYAGTVADGVSGTPSVGSNVVELRKADGAPEDAPRSGGQAQDRPISIIGAIKATSDVARTDVGDALLMLAVINLSLGLLNLLPFLPLDGGHAAVATYEAIRSRRGRPYRVDMAKLMPVTYAFLAFLLLFGLSAMFLDIRSPVVP